MCVICHKERGIAVPSEEIFKKCFTRNPDGAGILLHRKGTDFCEIHKGFMTFDKFKEALQELHIQEDDDAAFHFRITTSGGTNPENCHPFPITRVVKDLKATRINTTLAFVHNGVVGAGDTVDKISDTQVLIRDIISRDEICQYLDNEMVQRIISDIAGTSNRFLVADAAKNIFMRFGNWVEDKDSKCWFSNSLWKTSYYYDDYYYNGYNKNKKGTTDYYNGGYYSSKNNKQTTSSIPDIDTILCPNCDKKMSRLLDGVEYYVCQECGMIYNDRTFAVFNKKNNCWDSIIDINNFENYCG